MEKKRQSNIELFRILAMLFIIGVHYFAACNADEVIDKESLNNTIYIILESLFICGVNCFILITGYFSTNQKCIKIRKIVNLLIDVAFWGAIGFFLCVAFGMKVFGFKDLLTSMFPFIVGSRWFVKAYIVLLLLIPFINRIIFRLSKRSYIVLLIICTFLFSVWPSFFPFPPIDNFGYDFIHFIYLYLLSGFIRLHVEKLPPKMGCLAGYIVSSIAVVLMVHFRIGEYWAYNSIFVVIQSLCLFIFFLQLRMNNNRIINSLAMCSFGVFLIHTDPFFSEIIYEKVFRASSLINGSPIFLLLSVILCVFVFYMVCFFLESIKKFLFKYSIDKILDRISIINKGITIESQESTD